MKSKLSNVMSVEEMIFRYAYFLAKDSIDDPKEWFKFFNMLGTAQRSDDYSKIVERTTDLEKLYKKGGQDEDRKG